MRYDKVFFVAENSRLGVALNGTGTFDEIRHFAPQTLKLESEIPVSVHSRKFKSCKTRHSEALSHLAFIPLFAPVTSD